LARPCWVHSVGILRGLSRGYTAERWFSEQAGICCATIKPKGHQERAEKERKRTRDRKKTAPTNKNGGEEKLVLAAAGTSNKAALGSPSCL
jgi:hypothetical protein